MFDSSVRLALLPPAPFCRPLQTASHETHVKNFASGIKLYTVIHSYLGTWKASWRLTDCIARPAHFFRMGLCKTLIGFRFSRSPSRRQIVVHLSPTSSPWPLMYASLFLACSLTTRAPTPAYTPCTRSLLQPSRYPSSTTHPALPPSI